MGLNGHFSSLLSTTLCRLRGLFKPHYHPERHYMRGPGPACQARTRREGPPPAAM